MTLYRAGYLIFRATHSRFETFERNIGLLRKICTTENINSLAVRKDVVDANFWLDEVVNALNENNFFLMFFSRKSCSSRWTRRLLRIHRTQFSFRPRG